MIDAFDKFIVLKTGFGTIRDPGYGFSYEDMIAIASAINASNKPGAAEYDVWTDVERRCKRKRTRKIEPC